MPDDETSVRYGAAGSDFAAQCLEKRRILTSALSKINELSAADMISGNKKTRPVIHRRVFCALALSNDSGASPSAYRLLSCLRRNSLSMI